MVFPANGNGPGWRIGKNHAEAAMSRDGVAVVVGAAGGRFWTGCRRRGGSAR